MRVVTLGQLNQSPPLTVSMGGLGRGLGEGSETQARNTRAVVWFLGTLAVVGLGGFMLWKAR